MSIQLQEIKNIYVPVFQRIEYLESTGTQWIDTGIVPTSNTSFEIEFQPQYATYTFAPVAYCGEYFNSNDTFGFCIYNSKLITISYYGTFSNVFGGFNKFNIGDRLNVKFRRGDTNFVLNNKSTGITDSNSLNATFTNGSRTLYILYGNTKTDDFRHPSAMKLYFCKIYNGSTLIRDMIPVRVGSVGYMYDRVSGRLFGNAGTGNFILGQDVNSGLQQIYQNKLIEGVDYETADWLKGDGVAYIDIIFNIWKETLSYTIMPIDGKINDRVYSCMPRISNSDYIECRSFIGAVAEFNIRHSIRRNNQPLNIDTKVNGTYENKVYDVLLKRGDSDNYVVCTINGTTSVKNVLFDSSMDLDASMSIYAKAAKISAFNTDRYNLTPCTLLHSIPRNLDAQCKERVAGECGMIDLISGKFYGNVASTGQFTVENDNN